MPDLFNKSKQTLLRRVFNRRMRSLERMMRDPWAAQESTFRYLMRQVAATEFGRDHGLSPQTTLAEFRRRVPPHSYEDYEKYIERMLAGERSILWPGRVKYFSISSGTTAERGNKYVPFTNQLWLVNRSGGRDTLFFHCRRRNGDLGLFSGKMLLLGGTTDLTPVSTGIYSGDLSALTSRRLPPFYKQYYLPGDKIASISDWEVKIEHIARVVQGHDLKMISGIPSWLLVLIERIRHEYGDPHARLVDIFPDLRLVITGGVNVRPYLDIFHETIGEDVDYQEVYPSSEAFIGVQDESPEEGLLLMSDYGVFYEFVPAARIFEDDPPRLTVAEVETGVNYAILLTTPGGLYSYILGDTVRFLSTYPHRLIVTGRTKHFLSAFGEHLIVEEAEAAIREASRRTDSKVKEFTAAPVLPDTHGTPPHHEWLIEFKKAPADLDEFARRLDEMLKELNDDYAAHRLSDSSLAGPTITVLRDNSFFDFMKVRGKLGGQNKVPRLKNDREYADLLHALQDQPADGNLAASPDS